MSQKNVIFKKRSRDKSVGVYMGKRDFVDYTDFVEPVDGVVLVDPLLLKDKKAFVTLSCTFRYGRDDEDVMGIAFRRDIYQATRQMYPPLQDMDKSTHTRLQQKLLRKLGDDAYPFFFELPDNLPCSVGLQPLSSDERKHCAVEFEVMAYCAKDQDEKIQKRSSVRMAIRKVQYAPEQEGPGPMAETTQDFVMSNKPLNVEASLGKKTFYHGETISVQVNINNNSNKAVKNVIISVEQVANVVLYTNDSYSQTVATEDTSDTVAAGASMTKTYTILPLLSRNRDKRGIALDGKLKHEDTNLASSSIIKEGVLKEVLGILVSYKVVVKLVVGGMFGSSDVKVELPFQLMHPKPDLEKESEQDEDLDLEDNPKGPADEEEEAEA